jgi:uncharacterized membrane protein YozB (DUF420 family)
LIDFLNQPGFLGTNATIKSDLTLVIILITAILFTIGWRMAIRKQYNVHHYIQTTTAVLNSIVVILVMITSFYTHILPGIPGKLLEGDYAITTIHGLIGLTGLFLGLYIITSTNGVLPKRWRFRNYKKFMRLSYGIYMLATFLGVIIYTLAFVLGI